MKIQYGTTPVLPREALDMHLPMGTELLTDDGRHLAFGLVFYNRRLGGTYVLWWDRYADPPTWGVRRVVDGEVVR